MYLNGGRDWRVFTWWKERLQLYRWWWTFLRGDGLKFHNIWMLDEVLEEQGWCVFFFFSLPEYIKGCSSFHTNANISFIYTGIKPNTIKTLPPPLGVSCPSKHTKSSRNLEGMRIPPVPLSCFGISADSSLPSGESHIPGVKKKGKKKPSHPCLAKHLNIWVLPAGRHIAAEICSIYWDDGWITTHPPSLGLGSFFFSHGIDCGAEAGEYTEVRPQHSPCLISWESAGKRDPREEGDLLTGR